MITMLVLCLLVVDFDKKHCCAGNMFLVPGATVATLLMLGALHARRLYDDKKVHIGFVFLIN